VVLDTTQVPALPISVKLGDANLDGFPDLLLIVASGQDHVPKMLLSVPCGPGVLGCGSGHGRHGWSVATKGTETLDAVKDARSVSFLDMDEDVRFHAFTAGYCVHGGFRGPLISWCKEQAPWAMATFCSCRTISTTMRSS
jgi:hypothetical protein